MFKELLLKGTGWARGRNGYFIPRKVDCFKDIEGNLNLSVSSSRAGKTDPISLKISRAEALELAENILSVLKPKAETKLVVVIEGGNVQEIMANRPGVKICKVDYDCEGADRAEVKRVLQFGNNNKKTYELAYVRHWGEASPEPREIKRFFRNAMQ